MASSCYLFVLFLSTLFDYLCSQLEGSLSQWTSYQEDVQQFVAWIEQVEESLESGTKPCSEMRDKSANLGKAKVKKSTYLSVYFLLQSTFLIRCTVYTEKVSSSSSNIHFSPLLKTIFIKCKYFLPSS